MSTIVKDLLNVTNGQNIRTFVEGGAHINRKPIQEIEIFSILNVVANKPYHFDFGSINFDLIPLSCWGYKSTGVNSADSLEIRILDRNNQALLWDIDLSGNKEKVGNAFYYDFPFLCVATSHIVRITSSVTLDNFIIFGEKAKLNQIYSPTY